jgi:hypothetical protein
MLHKRRAAAPFAEDPTGSGSGSGARAGYSRLIRITPNRAAPFS